MQAPRSGPADFPTHVFSLLDHEKGPSVLADPHALLVQVRACPALEAEAWLWEGIQAFRGGDHAGAWRAWTAKAVLNAYQAGHEAFSSVPALLAKCLEAPERAPLYAALIRAFWQDNPQNVFLQKARWALDAKAAAADHTHRRPPLPEALFSRLPYLETPALLKALLTSFDYPTPIGVVFRVEKDTVQGWVFDPRRPAAQNPPVVMLKAAEHTITVHAGKTSPRLAKAGLSQTGGFFIRIPDWKTPLHFCFPDGRPLAGSPLFPPVPPTQTDLPSAHRQQGSSAKRTRPVAILIPVYRGLEATKDGLLSVLQSLSENTTPATVVVINDASPEPALVDFITALADDPRLHVITQTTNHGFIRSMNLAMQRCPAHDVVWLNADTRVCGNWLDRLRDLALSEKRIAAASPFSNHGELVSFPHTFRQSPMPSASAQAKLDALAKHAWNGQAPELEALCGFCVYIKREALNEVGLLDELTLAQGYGEDTDWSLRAQAKGWRFVLAPHVFVAHQGSVSFGEEKRWWVTRNNALIHARFPDAKQRYTHALIRDPLKPHRRRLQKARLHAWSLPTTAPSLFLIFGPEAWRHPALEKTVWDVGHPHATPTEATHAAMADECVLRWEPALPPTPSQWGVVHLCLPEGETALPIVIDYRLPLESDELVADLQRLRGLTWVFHDPHTLPSLLPTLCLENAIPFRLRPLTDESIGALLMNHAQTIELAWATHRAQTQQQYPMAKLVHSQHPRPVWADAPALSPETGCVLLMADRIVDPALAQRWLAFARASMRAPPEKRHTLILFYSTAWAEELTATGSVQVWAPVPGLSCKESLFLSGCRQALSLESTPGPGWRAPWLADRLGLGLVAPKSGPAQEAGAQCFEALGLCALFLSEEHTTS